MQLILKWRPKLAAAPLPDVAAVDTDFVTVIAIAAALASASVCSVCGTIQ
jgi:hypothetical protein